MIHKISIFLKTKFPKLVWKNAPLIWKGNTDPSIKGVQKLFSNEESISDKMLLKGVLKISKVRKVNSICEFGSGAGRNLFYLLTKLPHISYLGFDINKSLVQGGNNYLKINCQDDSIVLKEANIEVINLKHYKSNIIFTSMTLMYIHPNKISQVIKNIVENATSGVVFQEIQGVNDVSNPSAGYLHSYDNILENLNLDFDIEKSIINLDAWTNNQYQAYQYTLIRK